MFEQNGAPLIAKQKEALKNLMAAHVGPADKVYPAKYLVAGNNKRPICL